MRTYVKYMLFVAILFIATACDVHELPDYSKNNQDDDTRMEVTLGLQFDLTMPLYTQVTVSRADEQYDVRYIIECYKRTANNTYNDVPDEIATVVKRDISTLNQEVSVMLPSGFYRVIAWAEFVDDDDTDELYFETSNLQSVSINDAKAYSGNTDMADAYCCVTTIDVDAVRAENLYYVGMKRLMAKYEIIATDIEEFVKSRKNQSRADVIEDINEGNYRVEVTYSGFVPSTYNLVKDFTSDSRLDMHYEGQLTMLNETEALLAFDYVLINSDGGSVELSVSIIDQYGNYLATTNLITVPLMQGQLTEVRGSFLTDEYNSGGLGINPGFDGPDFNIHV